MFRTQPIPAEYLPSDDALPSLLYGLPELHYPTSLNLCQELLDGAITRGYGERVAYYAEDARITYAELQRQVCRLANGLRSDWLEKKEVWHGAG